MGDGDFSRLRMSVFFGRTIISRGLLSGGWHPVKIMHIITKIFFISHYFSINIFCIQNALSNGGYMKKLSIFDQIFDFQKEKAIYEIMQILRVCDSFFVLALLHLLRIHIQDLELKPWIRLDQFHL